MGRRYAGWLSLGLGLAIVGAIVTHSISFMGSGGFAFGSSALVLAQSPQPSLSPLPTASIPSVPVPLASPTTSPTASPTTSPTTSPTASPTTSPARPAQLPLPPAPPMPPPASVAAPLPLAGEYRDPSGRFKVGVLQNAQASPIAGSVLVESGDGDLAYAVVVQSQPVTNPIGLLPGLNTEALGQVAAIVFQRGEDFQPGLPQAEAGGGAVINWTGNLTIAGKAQPVGGVILVRPTSKTVLLLLIAATQSGSDRVQGALSALANTMQPL